MDTNLHTFIQSLNQHTFNAWNVLEASNNSILHGLLKEVSTKTYNLHTYHAWNVLLEGSNKLYIAWTTKGNYTAWTIAKGNYIA